MIKSMNKDRMTLYIAKDIMAAQMGMSVSHLVEGILAGIQIPETKK